LFDKFLENIQKTALLISNWYDNCLLSFKPLRMQNFKQIYRLILLLQLS